jgi:hypothetical protein
MPLRGYVKILDEGDPKAAEVMSVILGDVPRLGKLAVREAAMWHHVTLDSRRHGL